MGQKTSILGLLRKNVPLFVCVGLVGLSFLFQCHLEEWLPRSSGPRASNGEREIHVYGHSSVPTTTKNNVKPPAKLPLARVLAQEGSGVRGARLLFLEVGNQESEPIPLDHPLASFPQTSLTAYRDGGEHAVLPASAQPGPDASFLLGWPLVGPLAEAAMSQMEGPTASE